MLIGELSRRSGVSRDTIRYYEKLGFFAQNVSRRFGNGYKDYPSETTAQLRHIQRLKECGFTQTEIRGLLISDGRSHVCSSLPPRLVEKIADIEHQVATLQQHKHALVRILEACNGACDTSHGVPDCIPLDRQESAKTGSCR